MFSLLSLFKSVSQPSISLEENPEGPMLFFCLDDCYRAFSARLCLKTKEPAAMLCLLVSLQMSQYSRPQKTIISCTCSLRSERLQRTNSPSHVLPLCPRLLINAHNANVLSIFQNSYLKILQSEGTMFCFSGDCLNQLCIV
jgi:hypothetical protein